MPIWSRTVWLICLVLGAAPLAADQDLAAVRQEFLRAYAAAEQGADGEQSTSDSPALRNYLLYPYLEQRRLQRAVASDPVAEQTDEAVEKFLARHEVAPVTRELRRAWYASLARRKLWERYAANWREVDDPTLRCHAVSARLATQRMPEAQSLAVDLWKTSPDSLPACEAAFDHLRAQNLLTAELIDTRARLALQAGNPAFARQLIAMLPPDKAAPLHRWVALIERPRSAIDAAIAQPDKAVEAEALLDGWIRFARSDPSAAAQRYSELVRARKFDKAMASRYALEVALALAWSRKSESLRFFARVEAADMDERAYEWHLRSALWAEDWRLVSRIASALPEPMKEQTRWNYWSARAMEKLGNADGARAKYRSLLTDDNYYAALAAARLGVGYTPQLESVTEDEAELEKLASLRPFMMARELLQLGVSDLRALAYEEWRSGYNKLSAESRQQAVLLAARWGWHDQAVTIAAQQGIFNDYQLFYPRPFDAAVTEAAQRTSLSPALIYATLRQESLYRTDALSSAGAKGVMQLLPETATRVARRWKMDPRADLFDPELNIAIGAANLRDMIDRFGGKTPMALAAYNAGPNTVPRWLPPSNKESDIWIENIPYNETRTYIQRIYWHSLVFQWLAQREPQDAKHWLMSIPSKV